MPETQVTEIVGFDLGHGETAVAKAVAASDADPEMLELFGRKSQITAIGRHPSKGVVIGEWALSLPQMTRFDICFKQRPTHDLLYQQNMREFLAECYKHLAERGQIADGEATRFFVGCPSGWPDEVVAEYHQVLAASGIPAISVVRESRAALLHAKEGGKLTLGELKQSVLIVDMGSSTTDFTLVRGSSDQPLDFGDDLGAALIDQAILARTLEAHEKAAELKEIFAGQPLHRARCEVQCRRAKEAYFATEERYEDPESRTQTGFERIQDMYIFEPVVNGPVMRELLSQPQAELANKSWVQRFRELVNEAKRQLDQQGVTPSVVLLTGGASRMGFVREVAEATFSESSVRRDSEPEFCIARGLARWGRVDLRTARFTEEMDGLLESVLPELVGNHIAALREELCTPLVEGLLENVVQPGMRDWRSGEIQTLAALEPHMRALAEKWITSDEATQAIGTRCAEWFRPIQQELNNRTNEMCQRHRIPAGSLALDVSIDTPPITMPDVGPCSTTTERVTNVGAVITALVIASVLGGGGMALLMSGPIGWMIGLSIGLVAAYYGRAEAKKRIREINIPGLVRKTLLTDAKIEAQCAEMTPELSAKIKQQLQHMQGSFEELTVQLKDELRRALDAKADEARLLIK